MLNHATMRDLIDMVVRHSKIPQEDLRKIMGEMRKSFGFLTDKPKTVKRNGGESYVSVGH